jgi:hypothetical protein
MLRWHRGLEVDLGRIGIRVKYFLRNLLFPLRRRLVLLDRRCKQPHNY